MDNKKTYTLLELNKLIRNVLSSQFENQIWISAEINNIHEHNSGHCYLELIQKDDKSDKILSQARATIWSQNYIFIKSFFYSITQQNLRRGINILIKVSVDYHELYGLSLNIKEIEPSFTLGDFERKKREMIQKLISDGVFDMNRQLALPRVIQNIAVISSVNAAGFEDFIKHIKTNRYKYGFNIKLFNADMQGAKTEDSVVNALNIINEDHNSFDVVTIIRGGGSKSDLIYFDNYNIAYRVAQFPIPVIVGIGHERDESVVDLVAHSKFKNPTAVANFIADYNRIFEKDIEDNLNQIINRSYDIIKTNDIYITTLSLNILKTRNIINNNIEKCNKNYYLLKSIVSNMLQRHDFEINKTINSLNIESYRFINENTNKLINSSLHLTKQFRFNIQKNHIKLENLSQKLAIIDPQNILKKGYTITKKDGTIINSCVLLQEEDIIETHSSNFNILSRIIRVKKNTDN